MGSPYRFWEVFGTQSRDYCAAYRDLQKCRALAFLNYWALRCYHLLPDEQTDLRMLTELINSINSTLNKHIQRQNSPMNLDEV